MGSGIFREQLPYCRGPYSYSFIKSRTEKRYRVQDMKDDPVGWADSPEEAQAIVDRLTKQGE